MPVVRTYPLADVESRPAPNAYPSVGAAGDIGSFGGNQARDLQIAGGALERTSDNLGNIALSMFREANDTKVSELSNQYVEEQQKALFTGPNAFYRTRGAGAIEAAEPTTKGLMELKKNFLAQAKNDYQRNRLGARLDSHLQDATGGISRHVGTQSLVWQDTVAKGTIQAATNDAVLNSNDQAKVTLHAQGAWDTEYGRLLKVTGDTPEGKIAAKAGADAVRSNLLRSVIETQSVTDPAMAQRTLEANRDKLDASDVPTLSRKIKLESDARRTQDIVNLVTTTGGISPNYNARTQAAEGGATYTENKIGALGKYQFTKGTYTDFAQQTEWGKGKSQAEVRQMLLDPKEGEKKQDELKRLFDDRSLKVLTEKGIPINDLTLYTTHFLGQGAGPELLKLPDDTPLNPALVKAHTLPGIKDPKGYVDEVYRSNPFLAKVQTVGDLKALMAQKIGAPLTLASSGSPEKPNLDVMLQNGLAMAGNDPDLRDRVTQGIKNSYATKHALYTAQIGAIERQAFGHIDAGGTIENLPSAIKGALDADGLAKVQTYEEKRMAKRQKDNAELAGKGLTDKEQMGTLTEDDVVQQRNNLSEKEYRSWGRIARGDDRTDDPRSYEMLQRGLGTRDMRDDIFSEHNAGNISNQSRNQLLDKNAAFMKDGAPATPFKINHDRIDRALGPGMADNPVARELHGKALKEYDMYVRDNPQKEGETQQQYAKRIGDYSEDTIKRYTQVQWTQMSGTQAVPAHTTISRSEMTNLPKPDALKSIGSAYKDLAKKFGDGLISEEQFNRDAEALVKWKELVERRPDPAPAPTPRR